ncbi:MAG: hypothetical protein ABR936_17470 [Bacteroidota bacterium]|jgi:hypothetical protein
MNIIPNIALYISLFVVGQNPINPGQYSYVAWFSPDKCQMDTVYENNRQSSIDTIQEYKYNLDLNGDKYPELFIADRGCGKGLCGWQIIDGKTKKKLGFIEAWFVYITDRKTNGYPILETVSKNGCCEMSVTLYKYNGKRYSSTEHIHLTGDKLDNYLNRMNVWHQKLNGIKK